ncbi:MAG: Lrp/AsnC family transcriptional regulator [Nanoarchaeota archaeon]
MLDYIDEHIIEKLKHDGRTSLTDLSEGSDLSRVAIANRIEKLQQNGLLKVSALLNIEKLNYNTLIVELQVANEKKAEFRKMISGCSKVMQAFEISGQHNHLLICSAKNNNLLRKFVEDVLKKYATDCKVTLASNPIGTGYVHVKPSKACADCKKHGVE